MRTKTTLTVFLTFLFSLQLHGQLPSNEDIPTFIEYDTNQVLAKICKVYKYSSLDSLNMILQKVSGYREDGKILFTKEKSWMTDSLNGFQYFYDYKDSLLVQRRSIDEYNDSTKSQYYYNNAGKKIKEVHFDFARRVRDPISVGFGSGDCELDEEDLEEKGTWRKTSVIYFTYDSLGRLTEYQAPGIHWDSQNHYSWKYDDKNQIVEHVSYINDHVYWIKQYLYNTDSYQYTITSFNYAGNYAHLDENSIDYYPQKTYTIKLDQLGREIARVVRTEKNKLIEHTVSKYNEDGELSKVLEFDRNGKLESTFIFKYEYF